MNGYSAGSGPLGSGPTGPGSGFSVMPLLIAIESRGHFMATVLVSHFSYHDVDKPLSEWPCVTSGHIVIQT